MPIIETGKLKEAYNLSNTYDKSILLNLDVQDGTVFVVRSRKKDCITCGTEEATKELYVTAVHTQNTGLQKNLVFNGLNIFLDGKIIE